MMGTATTDITNWLLAGICFVDNVYTCLKIVWLRKRSSLDVNQQIELIEKLSMNETVEFLSPLAFLISFLVAFYGPNAKLMGNIRSTMYHYKPVEDIVNFSTKILTLYLADVCSLIVCSVILRLSCRINLFKAFMAIQNEFGLEMFLLLGFWMTSVRS
jgi:hypothetical protein